jgi:hypothetical protein
MRFKKCIIGFFSICCFVCFGTAYGQGFDPYSRVSDPRGICRLDGPDTLPIQFQVGVGWSPLRDTDGYFICGQDTGSGIITHLWMEFYNAVDSLLKVRVWIDDSLVISCGIDSFYKKNHGMLRAPLDSLASGGFNCDVQISYRRNYKVTFYAANYTYCCLFWGVERRPILDNHYLESFRLSPSISLTQKQVTAEKAYTNKGSPWSDPNSKTISVSANSTAGEITSLCDIHTQGFIQTIHIHADIHDIELLKNIRMRMYWDRSPEPSVDVPMLDFFGCGDGLKNVNGLQVRATDSGDFTSYFPMPFYTHARIELVNMANGTINLKTETIYSEEKIDRWNQGYFMAQFRESNPTRWHISHYVGRMLGRGKYIGMQISMPDNPQPYFLEGDPIFTVDSNSANTIHYIGLEDYLDGGWFFVDSTFSLPFGGCTRLWSSAYRFHYFDAYDFQNSFQFELQHGVRNDFETIFRTVAFFYRRWTPFWLSRDTIHANETLSFGGSGYSPNQQIIAKLDSQILFTSFADGSGEFIKDYVVPSNLSLGMHRVSVNDYLRPEPIYVLDKPTVRFLNDSLPPIFRWQDSLMIFGTGFKQGEKVSIFFDTVEASYMSTNRLVDQQYEFSIPIKFPWIPDGTYNIRAIGDQGTVAKADTVCRSTRTLNYECEDLSPIISEGYTEKSYLGYYNYDNWSNQYTRLFYPDGAGRRIVISFFVPVADSFHLTLFNTIGSRYGNYDISLDSEKVSSFFAYIDSASNSPFRSKELEGGIHNLSRGVHTMTYICTGKDPNGLDYLLNADNFIITPTTAFHPIPDSDLAATPANSIKSGVSMFSLSPNPLSDKILTVHLNLDSAFKLGSDILIIELFDILGKKAATVLDGTVGLSKMDITKDCSLLPTGKYICRIMKVTSGSVTTESIAFVIDR